MLKRNLNTKNLISGVFLLSLLLVSCDSTPDIIGVETPIDSETPAILALTPYVTRTATPTPLPPDPSTPTPLPTATPTPVVHVVSEGEDMYGIAYRYGITVNELMDANPEANPRLLSVGMELLIPYVAEQVGEETGELPTPTPAIVQQSPAQCYQNALEGVWCFVIIQNDLPMPIESVSGIFRMIIGDQGEMRSKAATTLLNIIHPGESQPVLAYFPPGEGTGQQYQVSFELISALEISDPEGDKRYLDAYAEDISYDFSESGGSVTVRGKIVILDERPVGKIQVMAAAYDEAGRIVGARRWQGTAEAEGFDLTVYSLGGDIAFVDVSLEGLPSDVQVPD